MKRIGIRAAWAGIGFFLLLVAALNLSPALGQDAECVNLFDNAVNITEVEVLSNIATNPLISLTIDRVSNANCVSIDLGIAPLVDLPGTCRPLIVGLADLDTGALTLELPIVTRQQKINVYAFCTRLDLVENRSLRIVSDDRYDQAQPWRREYYDPSPLPPAIAPILERIDSGACLGQNGAPLGYASLPAQLAVLTAFAEAPQDIYRRLWAEQKLLWYGAAFDAIACLLNEEQPPSVLAAFTADVERGMAPLRVAITNTTAQRGYALGYDLIVTRVDAEAVEPIALAALGLDAQFPAVDFESAVLELAEPGTYTIELRVQGAPLIIEGQAVKASETAYASQVVVSDPPRAPSGAIIPTPTPVAFWAAEYDVAPLPGPRPLWQWVLGSAMLIAGAGMSVAVVVGATSTAVEGVVARRRAARLRVILLILLIIALVVLTMTLRDRAAG